MLNDINGLTAADVAAVTRNNGFGGDMNGGWWILLLFLFAMNGGNWGNGAGNGNIQRGFDQAATSAGIQSLTTQVGTGFADAAVANCQGNAAITAAITNGQYATAQAINTAENSITGAITNSQMANLQSQNSLAMALQQCCCDNKAGIADLKYTIATENCADRQAISDGIRDLMAQNTANTNALIQNQTAGFQGIQDKLCQLEIDGLKQANEQLRTQLNMAALAASQTQQTSQLIQTLRPAPIPSYTVANPFAPTTTTATA